MLVNMGWFIAGVVTAIVVAVVLSFTFFNPDDWGW